MNDKISDVHGKPERAEIDQFLLGCLTGAPSDWPSAWSDPASHEAVWQRLHFHGVCLSISQMGSRNELWPPLILDRVAEEARLQIMWELYHKDALAKLLAAFAAANVQNLVLKGTALAYSLYENPAERRRGDTDLLVQENDLSKARRTLEAAGFRRIPGTSGLFGDLHYQEIWRLDPSNGLTHDIDLHWQVTNSRALKNVLAVEEFFSGAVLLDRLSANALTPDPASRLIHGAVNRAVHGRDGYWSLGRLLYDQDRLAWARDFHLQASRFNPDDWKAFTDRAIEKGLAPLCLDALLFAQRCFSTQLPPHVVTTLSGAPKSSLAMAYIEEHGQMAKAWSDFTATEGFGKKLLFILARALPSGALLRAKYPDHSNWPIGALQLLRLYQAAPRLLRAMHNTWG